MSIKLAKLPYDKDALEPHVSAKTLEFHHGKHHKAYVDKLNKAIVNTAYAELSLEAIVTRSYGANHTAIYNNAAQAWNHDFLWQSMSPTGGGKPKVPLKKQLDEAFGSYEKFVKAFKTAATEQFGSGWAWLVWDQGKLAVLSTSNADSPLVLDPQPLLTLDVWEHAYYLDYQNERAAYVDVFLEHLVNWEFAAANLDGIQSLN